MLRGPKFSPLKALLLGLTAVWGFGLLVGGLLGNALGHRDAPAIQTAPLLKQIQQLGDLHTVRYSVHDVLEHQRSLDAPRWASAIPGVDRVFSAATVNSVVITAEGGIEAGVDLSRVTPDSVSQVVTREGALIRIRLPRANVYTPDVRVKVVDRKTGLFWNDENIVPEAEEVAGGRFRQAALKSGILAAAEANAIMRLSTLQGVAGSHKVEFYF
jgi:hypothetical protein